MIFFHNPVTDDNGRAVAKLPPNIRKSEVTNYKQSSVFFGILWFIKKGNLNKPSENSVFQMEGVNL